MDPADLIEENSDYIGHKLFCWTLANSNEVAANSERFQIIQKFVEWCAAEDQKDLDVPRNPDGKSFRQRREETPGWWKNEWMSLGNFANTPRKIIRYPFKFKQLVFDFQ